MSNPISPEGFEKLRAEWEHLFREVRPKLLEEIAAAAAQGDRSENAEYIYGRKKLREIDRRLRALDGKISRSTVVQGVRRDDKIYLGARVTLRRQGAAAAMVVRIVGNDEIDPVEGKISRESPLGLALLGHAPSGRIAVDTPRGRMEYDIEAVHYD
ncbi:MAG: greB [Fibrobacteria bacterium]|jgi:transcription elongation factor GreB|nr:greB [Fibrobacteria bacterium]